MEATVQAPIFPMIRRGLHFLTRKLLTEVLVSSLATLLVMAMFSSVMKATPPSSGVAADPAARPASASGEKTANFMEQVALSHVVGLKPAAADPSSTAAAASRPAGAAGPGSVVVASAAAPAALVQPAHPSAERGHDRAHASAARVAADIPDVLPPPRPPVAAPEPVAAAEPVATVEPAVVVAAPQKEKPHRIIDYGLRPLRFGMHIVTNVVDFVPASGTRVVEGVASVGDALTSFAKKL